MYGYESLTFVHQAQEKDKQKFAYPWDNLSLTDPRVASL